MLHEQKLITLGGEELYVNSFGEPLVDFFIAEQIGAKFYISSVKRFYTQN